MPEEKNPKIEIVWQKGRTVRMRFDYGKELTVTFPPDRTDEEIIEEMKQFYEHHKEKPKELVLPQKINW